ncbi:MAG: LPS-assembly protein LptD [Rhizobiales bacterium]|nr:LPS-assembly protein LptD [Hyphomicrobiales bacterium]
MAPETNAPAPGTRVDVDASKITYDGRKKIATAIGEVRLVYGPYVLVASKIVYDLANDTMTANGSVELREPNGNILQADTATLKNKFKEGFAHHLRALLTNDVTITADYAQRFENGITIYEKATYTACKECRRSNGDPLWVIVSDETTHDEELRTLYHRNAKFLIGGVPVGWLPYLEHPDPTVKRRTGFLVPSFKAGNAYGFGVVTPYFWAPAPNYDMTFSPVWTTKQGPVADIELRHRLKSGGYRIRGQGLYQLEKDEYPGDIRWRGALASDGAFAINDHWTWGWDGQVTSDRRFLSRYDYDSPDLITSQVYLRGLENRSYFSAQALHFQSQISGEADSHFPAALPYVESNVTFDQPVLGGEFGIDTYVYSLHRNDPDAPFDTVNHGTEQSRVVTSLRWQRQMINGFGQVFTPFARLRSDVFINDNLPDASVAGGLRDEETTARILPMAGVDMRWPMFASYESGSSIFEPVFQLVAATNETDTGRIGNEDAISLNFDHTSLFLQDRFTGFDRYEGGTRANLGFVYSYLASNGGSAKVSLGESFHIAGRNSFVEGSGLEGTSSDLVAAISLQPWEHFRFSYQARIEEDFSDINSQEASLSLTFDRISTSLSYVALESEAAYGRTEAAEQVWGDATYWFRDGWNVFGGFRYDLANDEFLARSIGIGFDCDCMNAKLTYSENETTEEDSDTDRRLMFSVDLRTLGGTSVSTGF